MTTNAEAAEAFREIADLLDVLGERFKPEAYRRASRSIESLTEDLGTVAARGELRSVPGVGDAIEEKIQEFLKTGHIDYYERLKKEVPAGLLEILKLPGLGPKTARRFWLELGVEGPAELAAAIDAGRLNGVKGFGPKKIEQIREALAAAKSQPAAGRMPIEAAYGIAHRLLDGVRASGVVEQLEIAGSFRRCRETVGDLDILATSSQPEKVFDTFSQLPDVRVVRLRGPTKETVVLTNGLQVDLRVVEPKEFGAALLYFTGSKDHNVHLRSIARDRGLKINEYGIFRGEALVGGRTEEEMYGALDLAWVPPEIREDRGEVDLAAQRALPQLVEGRDLTGDLHLHLPDDAKPAEVERLVAAARAHRWGYAAVVVGGIREDGSPFSVSPEVLKAIGSGGAHGVRIGRAWEIGPDRESIPTGAAAPDLIILRPTRAHPGPPSAPAPHDVPTQVAHVGGEEATRAWVAWLKGAPGTIEVGPGPERLDSGGARAALGAGVALNVVTGLGRPDEDPTAPISLGFARRASAEKGSIRNAAPAAAVTRSWSGGRTGRSPSAS